MKILIQRVLKCDVTIDKQLYSSIDKGLLLYICFESEDKIEVIDKAINKILALRIFEDDEGKMNQNIIQKDFSLMSVSQFTLSWNGQKGNRPSFENSMKPDDASKFYELFNNKLQEKFGNMESGVFGADMKVSSINDGPVTFFLSF